MPAEEVNILELRNVRYAERSRDPWRSLRSLLCAVTSEYMLGVCGIPPSDPLYARIHGYFEYGNLTSEELYGLFASDEQAGELVRAFGIRFNEGGEQLREFAERFRWEFSEEGSRFTVGDMSFGAPNTLLTIGRAADGTYAMVYSVVAEDRSFVPISSGRSVPVLRRSAVPLAEPCAGKTSGPLLSPTSIVSEERFFECSGSLGALDPEQRQAVTADIDRDLVIVAGAGSGKTRSLVGRMCYIHAVRGIPLDRLLMLTFTRNATATLSRSGTELLREIYEKAGVRSADLPQANASTIDAFCLKVLKEYWADIGFTELPDIDLGPNVADRMKVLLSGLRDEHHLGRLPLDRSELYIVYENAAHGSSTEQPEAEGLVDYAVGWMLSNNSVIGFSAVEYLVRRALSVPGSMLAEALRGRYDCIFVDEYQDVNVVQDDIMMLLSDMNVHMTFVGDDDQTIYYWRGSDSSILKDVYRDPANRHVCLTTNYRCNPHIVSAGNAILDTIDDRSKEDVRIRAHKTDGPKIRVSEYDSDLADLCNEIGKLHSSGPGRICVLSPRNEEVRRLKAVLDAAGIPAYSFTDDTASLSEDYRVFRSLVMVLNDSSLKSALDEINRVLHSEFTSTELKHYVKGDISFKGSNRGELERYEDFLELVRAMNVSHRAASTMEDMASEFCTALTDIRGKASGERPEADACMKALTEYAAAYGCPYPPARKGLRQFFGRFEQGYQCRRSNALKSDGNEVVLSTIHAAKGLEYDSVFIIGMNGNYPSVYHADQKYHEKLKQLERMKTVLEELGDLRGTARDVDIDAVIACTEGSAWDGNVPEGVPELGEALESWADDLDNYSAEDVEALLGIYHDLYDPVRKRYASRISDALSAMKALEEAQDNVQERQLADGLSEEEVRALQEEFAEIRERKREAAKSIGAARNADADLRKRLKPFLDLSDLCTRLRSMMLLSKVAGQLEEMRRQLEYEYEETLREQRRVFYVAVSRASERLYLCNEAGRGESPFISMIPSGDMVCYRMAAPGEDSEVRRISTLKSILDHSLEGPEPDLTVADAITDDIIGDTTGPLKLRMDQAYRDTVTRSAVLGTLKGEAEVYLRKAVCLRTLSGLGVDFGREVVMNVRRSAESLLLGLVRFPPEPLMLDDERVVEIGNLLGKVPREGRSCFSVPRKEYLRDVLSSSQPRSDGLRSLALGFYAAHLNRGAVPDISWGAVTDSWDPETFVAAALDLSGMGGRCAEADFPTEQVTAAFGCLEDIVRSV